MKSKLSYLFILFAILHLNLIIPVSKASDSSDICIMNNGIYTAHHSDNQKIHDHRGSVRQAHEAHHVHNNKGIHQIKMDCNMDMSSSDIYFPGGEHPFTNSELMQASKFELPYIGAASFQQIKILEGFITLPDNPPKFIS
ncbi:MAG: hypothetical protein HY279_09590 [Nitrospinae bacterium]|nr:hypothetical protein [Nitrospinota bacterium]